MKNSMHQIVQQQQPAPHLRQQQMREYFLKKSYPIFSMNFYVIVFFFFKF
jgi:hypothetical protein